MPLNNEKFEIDKAALGQNAAALNSECVSAMKGAKSAEQAGTGIAAAVKKFVEATVALIETTIEEGEFAKKSDIPPPSPPGGVPGA